MLVQVVGCSHRGASIELRERLAFSPDEVREALDQWRRVFPGVEAVLLSTCNRVEIYAATENQPEPSLDQIVSFLARFHDIEPAEVAERLCRHTDEAAVRTPVLGDRGIGQHGARRVANTSPGERRPIRWPRSRTPPARCCMRRSNRRCVRRSESPLKRPSIGGTSACPAWRWPTSPGAIFERFDDKRALVIGAGEMADETLYHLRSEGVRQVTVVNRSFARAAELAEHWGGEPRRWDELPSAIADADLIVSATGADEAVVGDDMFAEIETHRPLVIIDLAVPRDFDPAIGRRADVYLYSIDDLQAVCEENRRRRDKELPAAMRVVEQETGRFMAEMYHRAIGPVIERLKVGWQKPKEDELARLLGRLPALDERDREEVRRSFDRLVNKLLHPPLESLRDESRQGVPRGLLDALARLFQLKD